MQQRTYIFDLDGTLCDIGHRLHFITGEKKDWNGFNAACVDDALKEPIARLFWGLQNFHTMVIVTGRQGTDKVKADTAEWLYRNNIDYDFIFFRKAGDFRSDHLVKRDIYELQIAPQPWGNVEMVIDDRDRVVEMWRSLGLTCLQCQKGDY